MADGKKDCFIKARLSAAELQQLRALEVASGLNRTELLRKALFGAAAPGINAREIRSKLDEIGTELGRAGNNINQLARHANTLRLRGQLSEPVILEFILTFRQYATIRRNTEQALRTLIRLLRG